MALNLDTVGKPSEPIKTSYSWKDAVLYALGVGAKADELDYLLELRGPKVLPTFATIPCFRAMGETLARVNADLRMVVHGEQKITLHRPLPARAELSTVAEVTGIYDKGKGALIVVDAATADANGDELFHNQFSIFVRGAGGFGGERGPKNESPEPPDRAPDFEVSEETSSEQALLYRLSGDLNPLHADPKMAKAVGFDGPILHGLCTYGFAGRAALAQACGGDVSRFKSFAARFSGVVYPGDALTTRGWKRDDGSYVLSVVAGEDREVLKNAVVEVNPAA